MLMPLKVSVYLDLALLGERRQNATLDHVASHCFLSGANSSTIVRSEPEALVRTSCTSMPWLHTAASSAAVSSGWGQHANAQDMVNKWQNAASLVGEISWPEMTRAPPRHCKGDGQTWSTLQTPTCAEHSGYNLRASLKLRAR